MKIDKFFIGKRVRKARLENKLTQRDLAKHLGRSIGAISQLEKGITAVSAEDLYQIAVYFQKPIEFFFIDEEGEKLLDSFMDNLRRQPPEARKLSLELSNHLAGIYQLGDRLKLEDRSEISNEELKKFILDFFPAISAINAIAAFLNEIWEIVLTDPQTKSIDIQKLLDSVNIPLDIETLQQMVDNN